MLAGILSIDRVLLIVAADDGPRPQTSSISTSSNLSGRPGDRGGDQDRPGAARTPRAVEAEIAQLPPRWI
jgi:hypothetical protein